ncbi:spermidine synthase [Peribacillus acanthi]|uniref:spermine/spermidine synthase domain-containing protein n=1 Tax=Peribacillus acanthi TaxID=2171554 RepID=UPI000D3E4F34|nr:spermidine synthase [Peribacillus acanthi]
MDYAQPKLWVSNPQTKKANVVQNSKSNPQSDNKKRTPSDTVNIWDSISLRAMKKENHKKIYQGRNEHQDIQVIEAREIRMYLDEQLQFSSLDERIYHEAFVHVPFSLSNRYRSVLILGGGEGLALREVLKYKDVNHVDLVDIDAKILHLSAKSPEMVTLNNRSLHDRRVNVHATDGIQFINKINKKYDIIILDFPDPENEDLAALYTLEVFERLYSILSDEGMLVVQSNSPEDTPIVYWSIGLTMEKAGFYTKSYHTIVPSFGDWGFHLGGKKRINQSFKPVQVPNETLPNDLSTLFNFHHAYLSSKRRAVVNRKHNPILHTIFNQEIEKWEDPVRKSEMRN